MSKSKVLPLRPSNHMPPPPKGLSPKWCDEWRKHFEEHDEWEHHERVLLGQALVWWTRQDDFIKKAKQAKTPRDARAFQVQARDCAQMGLRYYRPLKFENGDKPKKTAGRKSDTGYSEIRGAGA
jgi:hypothetical protein